MVVFALQAMVDRIEEVVAPAAIERAMTIFEQFGERDHGELQQARKALHEFIYGLVAKGEIDEQRFVVEGLAHLKKIDSRRVPCS